MGEEEIEHADRRSKVHGGRRMEAWAGEGLVRRTSQRQKPD